MTNIILYHNKDMDGFLGAASVVKSINNYMEKIHFIGGNYEPHLSDTILKYLDEADDPCKLYIVDHSIPPSELIKIAHHKNMKSIFLYDHHISAINDFKKAGLIVEHQEKKINEKICFVAVPDKLPNFKACLVDGVSGCYIAYHELVNCFVIPYIIELASIFDTWEKENPDFEDAKKLALGIQSYLKERNIPFLCENLTDKLFLSKMIVSGNYIQEYLDNMNYNISTENAFNLQFENLYFCACNTSVSGSFAIEPAATLEHDALLSFKWNGVKKKWAISMYHNPKSLNKPDLSVIAKKYGGGGHAGACGFMIDKLPFKLD